MRKILDSIINVNGERKIIEGPVVDLRIRYVVDENQAFDGIPTVYYSILLHGTKERVGTIDLRLKMDEDMYYYGHVGYGVDPKYRGHHYSYEACKLVFNEAKNTYHLNELYLTCNPDNIASYKTLQKLNGELVEVAQVPKEHELYKRGDKLKCIFRYKISI